MHTLYWGLGGIVVLVAVTFLSTYFDSKRSVKWKKKIGKVRYPFHPYDRAANHNAPSLDLTRGFGAEKHNS